MSGLLSARRFRRRTATLLAVSGGSAWVAGCGLVLIGERRYEWPGPTGDVLPALVLGCPPGPAFERRLAAARMLFASGRASRIVVSGRGEAEWGLDWLRAAGVPEDALLAEPAARNTWENLALSAPLLGPGRFHLVTDAWHLPRALLSADALGQAACPAPVKGSLSVRSVAREGMAVVMTVSGGHVPARRWLSWCVAGTHER